MGNSRDLTAEASLIQRLWGYLGERFPIGPYGVLVALFYGSATSVARAFDGGGGVSDWRGAVVMLLVFFHLRVFDEHKDADVDNIAHPERLLSRGVVTLPLLARAGLLTIGLEVLLSALIGPVALSWWLCAFLFTLAMRAEFGVGEWLNKHFILYAVTHNPVVGLLAAFAWATTETVFHPSYWAYIALVSVGSLAFEVGRKLRLPDEEIDGVPSYSSVLGRSKAGIFLATLSALTAGLTLWLCHTLSAEWYAYAAAVIAFAAGAVPALTGKGEKAVEGGASLLLLGALGAAWLAV